VGGDEVVAAPAGPNIVLRIARERTGRLGSKRKGCMTRTVSALMNVVFATPGTEAFLAKRHAQGPTPYAYTEAIDEIRTAAVTRQSMEATLGD
jgi:hypothetical protein